MPIDPNVPVNPLLGSLFLAYMAMALLLRVVILTTPLAIAVTTREPRPILWIVVLLTIGSAATVFSSIVWATGLWAGALTLLILTNARRCFSACASQEPTQERTRQ